LDKMAEVVDNISKWLVWPAMALIPSTFC
jgi:hypothetical protein